MACISLMPPDEVEGTGNVLVPDGDVPHLLLLPLCLTSCLYLVQQLIADLVVSCSSSIQIRILS